VRRWSNQTHLLTQALLTNRFFAQIDEMSKEKVFSAPISASYYQETFSLKKERRKEFKMKRLAIVLLIMFGLAAIGAAQSGRRVVSTPTPTPQIDVPQDAGGFSESQPNTVRQIVRAGKKDKKSKKDTKAQNKSIETPAATTDAASDDGDELKIETNLITIPVSVYERNGIYVPNLRQTDFKIFEDGVEQEIAYFGASEKPFTVILLIDVSPSTAYKIEEIQNAAISFIDQLKSQDSVMVIQFDSAVTVLTEATSDRQKIYKAIRRTGFGDGTSLYEAVDFSLRKRLSKIEGRKAIVLFTDGVDTTSMRANFDSTLDDAEEADAIIFPIYYNTYLSNLGIGTGGVMSTPPTLGLPQGSMQGGSSADYARGRAYLEGLAGATGGRVFRPESTPGGLTAAFEGIAEELRRQYNIGYYPQAVGENGQRKQIKVRVNRPNVAVRARDSYIVGATDTSVKK
jgi:Ca-activated chloride channel homolog